MSCTSPINCEEANSSNCVKKTCIVEKKNMMAPNSDSQRKKSLGEICERCMVACVGRREAGWVRRSGVRGEEERVVVDNESGQL